MTVTLRTGRAMRRQPEPSAANTARAEARARRRERGPTPRCNRCLAYGVPLQPGPGGLLCRHCLLTEET